MQSEKQLWTIDWGLLNAYQKRLLQVDLFDVSDVMEIWQISEREADQFIKQNYDSVAFFTNSDYLIKTQFAQYFNFDLELLTKLMNFFLWVKNSLNLFHIEKLFTDENMNLKWINWKNNLIYADSQKTIGFFFSFDEADQRRIVKYYEMYFKSKL